MLTTRRLLPASVLPANRVPYPGAYAGGLALVCGSPTLPLGALFLWLGTRRLKR